MTTPRRFATVAAILAPVLALVLTGGPATAASNCLDRLNGRSHSCQVIDSVQQTPFTAEVSFDGGMMTFAGRDDYTCSCGITGSFRKPRFDASKTEWTCVAAFLIAGEPRAHAVRGSVGANGKITRVTSAATNGVTGTFSCALD
jgi:hypothetical protein